jgi:hypothetical protein
MLICDQPSFTRWPSFVISINIGRGASLFRWAFLAGRPTIFGSIISKRYRHLVLISRGVSLEFWRRSVLVLSGDEWNRRSN